MKMLRGKGFGGGGGVADPRSGGTVATNDIGFKKGPRQESHTCPTKHGMGDYYGTGVKNPQGRMRGDSIGYRPVSKKQLGTPPKSLV